MYLQCSRVTGGFLNRFGKGSYNASPPKIIPLDHILHVMEHSVAVTGLLKYYMGLVRLEEGTALQ